MTPLNVSRINCTDCNRLIAAHGPIIVCSCGTLNTVRNHKYQIDFTLKKHGQFMVNARNEEEAKEKFKTMIKNYKGDLTQFIESFIYDYEIDTNYAYQDGSS